MNKNIAVVACCLLLVSNIDATEARSAVPTKCEVLVYGGTPGGIAAAIASAEDGANVLLVEPTRHLGGLTTSGLSHTDFHSFEGLSGAFLEFANRVEAYYREKYGPDSPQLDACRRGTHGEPHVNELVFEKMLAEQKNITICRELRLTSVETSKQGTKHRTIEAVLLIDGEGAQHRVSAEIFIDGTYEGDLMAAAGVPYRVGREARSEYDESLAPAKADGQVQAYNFRFTMTPDPKLRVAVEKPAGYDRNMFVDLPPLLTSGRIKRVFDYPSNCIFKAHSPNLPNNKFDINDVSRGIVRLSMPGENLSWPDGDASARQEVFERHFNYNAGLLWFLQHDESVPKKFRDEAQEWGWCRDEYIDNSHVPWQLYIREARRMKGEHVFNEHDMDSAPNDARSLFHPDAIAMGEYGPNCHGTSHEGPRYGGRHTGEFYKRVAPYQIPYGVLTPRDVDNLLVPVAASSSHVGFCALRLEPIWMSLGQASGVAARLALAEKNAVQDVSIPKIQRILHDQGSATIYLSDVPPDSSLFAAVQWLGSLGGLHGLSSPGKEPGQRGAHIESQYYEAYPHHAFEPDKPLDRKLRDLWIALLPETSRAEAMNHLVEGKNFTRKEAVEWLFTFGIEAR